jgi:hypothetical protein
MVSPTLRQMLFGEEQRQLARLLRPASPPRRGSLPSGSSPWRERRNRRSQRRDREKGREDQGSNGRIDEKMRKNEFEIGDLNDLDLDSHGGGRFFKGLSFHTHFRKLSKKRIEKS